MKKVISSLAFAAVITFGFASFSNAQQDPDADPNAAPTEEVIEEDTTEAAAGPDVTDATAGESTEGAEDEKAELTFVQELKKQFKVGILFFNAINDIFLAGSIPSIFVPHFLKPSRRVPTLLPMSTTRSSLRRSYSFFTDLAKSK